MAYKPIADYGIIGNMRTAALVAMDGSVDWLCLPAFDSPSVFGALLDDRKGGFFRIWPEPEKSGRKQFYWPDSNVLISRFMSADGVGELTDFMPVGRVPGHPVNVLIRDVHCTRGCMKFHMECRPAFDYARELPRVRVTRDGACFRGRSLTLSLTSSVGLRRVKGPAAVADFSLCEGQRAVFTLSQMEPGKACARLLSQREGYDLLTDTVAFWQRWLSRCTYQGRWREIVQRSALALKLMTYEPTGAIVAAVTTSLPEKVGGYRNWDYRYTWVRDAAFTVYALMRIGLTDEARSFMQWIEGRCHELKTEIPLQVMYGIDGRQELPELELSHLKGYRGSRPVRIGNAAYSQLQLDIYGELLDSVYLFNKYGTPIAAELWHHLRTLADWVCDHWQEPDAGIWEVRGGPRHFVYSKLMCWVALDRAVRLALKRSLPADVACWQSTRDRIYEDILARGWNQKRQAFTLDYGSQALDAAALLMPLVFFLSPSDPQMLKTIAAISQPPERRGLLSDSLLYRYDRGTAAGLAAEEGSFNMCTFWLVEALTRAGRADPALLSQARLIFEKMLCYANHLGLYAEETGPQGEALGNFPQAFTHLSLISSAFNLDRALGASRA